MIASLKEGKLGRRVTIGIILVVLGMSCGIEYILYNRHFFWSQMVSNHKTKNVLHNTSQWWKIPASQIAQPFEPIVDDSWCLLRPPSTIKQSTPEKTDHAVWAAAGLIFVKSHKSSSTTGAGITERIARHVAHRMHATGRADGNSFQHCLHYDQHEFAGNGWHGQLSTKLPHIMWTFVRYPSNRDLSHAYYRLVYRFGQSNTDDVILGWMKETYLAYQLLYLLPRRADSKKVRALLKEQESQSSVAPSLRTREVVTRLVQEKILHSYNFIGVTERMDESLAVLTLLWNLEATDVIVLSSKISGDLDYANCMRIPRANRTQAVQEYFASNFYQGTQWDFLLYHAVNHSLDMTIQALGETRVEERVDEIRRLRDLVESKCAEQVKPPCISEGVLDDSKPRPICYISDAGCGYPCVDRVLLGHETGIS